MTFVMPFDIKTKVEFAVPQLKELYNPAFLKKRGSTNVQKQVGSVSYGGKSMLILSPLDQPENASVSKEVFTEGMRQIIYQYFGTQFDWKNMMIAGEIISNILIGNNQTDGLQLYLYDATPEIIVERMQYICGFFINEKNKLITLILDRNRLVMTIHLSGKLPIEVYAVLQQSKSEVIKQIEFPLYQMGYTGYELVYSNQFIETITSRVVFSNEWSTLHQMQMAYQFGFHIFYHSEVDEMLTDLPSQIQGSEKSKLLFDPNQEQQFIKTYYKDPTVMIFLCSDNYREDIQLMVDGVHEYL